MTPDLGLLRAMRSIVHIDTKCMTISGDKGSSGGEGGLVIKEVRVAKEIRVVN